MARFDDEYMSASPNVRQKDLVLSSNEFVFIQNKTNGQIRTYTGPLMVTISAQESLVVFNNKTKRFEETNDFNTARQLFSSAPEGWYVVLKNPAKDNIHPEAGKAVNSPDLMIGKKINIAGPCSFSLYPGQMAKVIRGHRLRSNQYLIARVYDAEAAQKSAATIIDAEGKEVQSDEDYFVGKMLVIKGTEVSFYIPPTGIEVLAVDKVDGHGGPNDQYIRDAVTLERLEYVILKDESGVKRYVPGPDVVFPKPTETFVESGSKKGGVLFRALELSPISGIYVKVIADYRDEDGTEHKTGEELFITGNQQMIYYPRPEHALIQYDGKYMHHAIAIPEGEGRYVLNRLSGEIKTIFGPTMYLPDPRYEVVVKRKLSDKECALFYPGNAEALEYNRGLNELALEKQVRLGKGITDAVNSAYSTANATDSLAIFEATANISRGNSYTKPRTITLDTKYEGVVAINVWTGYAICVVGKNGNREIVVGPATRLLNYDETLEPIMTPEGETVFLKLENNKIVDTISAQTSDHVSVNIKVAYYVNFSKGENVKWFDVNNYTKYIGDCMRNTIKRTIRNHTVQDFYANSLNIVRDAVLSDENEVHIFNNNDSVIIDLEISGIEVEKTIARMLFEHQEEILTKNLELADADAKMKVVTALAEVDKQKADLDAANKLYKLELEQKYLEEKMAKAELIKAKERAANEAEAQAKSDLQGVLTAIHEAELARAAAVRDAEIQHEKRLAEIEKDKQKAYAETVEQIVKAISPDLVAALTSSANADLLSAGMANMSPYAIANGESVSDTVNKLLRGTPLEGMLDKIMTKQ